MKKRLMIVGILIIIPFLVYLNCLHNDFVYDDFHLVSKNQGIRGLHNIPFIFGLKERVGSYRPVRMASYALDYFINQHLWSHFEALIGRYDGYDWGLNPFGYHFSNLFYHLITVLLVLLVVKTLTGNLLVSFWAALLFSIHPVHTESVAYISGRRDILSTLFYLLGFYSFISYRASSKWGYIILFLLCYLLALGSKEMAVTLPLLCFCYDIVRYLQVESAKRQLSSFKNIFMALKEVVITHRYFYSPMLIAAAYFTYYKVWLKSPSQRHSFYGGSIYLNFLTVFKVMIHYLKLMFYPINLTVDYSYNGFPVASSLFEPATFSAVLILIFILYGLWRLLFTFPLLSFGILWWFLTLLPVCQIFTHHELLAEHYLYLPSVGFFMCVALILTKGVEAGKWRTVASISLGVVIVLFAARTLCRNQDWRDGVSLWEKTVKVVPNCVRAHNNLGVWYYKQGSYQKAVESHQTALRLNPDSADSYNNLGNVYLMRGLYGEAENHYRRAIQIDPDYEKAYSNLGMVYIKAKRYEEAKTPLKEAVRLDARFANPYYGMGLISLLTRDSCDRPDLALGWAVFGFKNAIKYNPEFAEAYSNLGSIYIMKGQYEEAEQTLVKAIRLKPDLLDAHKNLAVLYEIMGREDKAVETYFNLALAYQNQGIGDKAIKYYQRTIELKPDFSQALNNMGSLYALKGDREKAISLFKRAVEVNPDWALAHNNLGSVYREEGHLLKAIKEYEIAASLDGSYSDPHFNLAQLYVNNLKETEKALYHYKKGIAVNPDHPRVDSIKKIVRRLEKIIHHSPAKED